AHHQEAAHHGNGDLLAPHRGQIDLVARLRLVLAHHDGRCPRGGEGRDPGAADRRVDDRLELAIPILHVRPRRAVHLGWRLRPPRLDGAPGERLIYRTDLANGLLDVQHGLLPWLPGVSATRAFAVREPARPSRARARGG